MCEGRHGDLEESGCSKGSGEDAPQGSVVYVYEAIRFSVRERKNRIKKIKVVRGALRFCNMKKIMRRKKRNAR